MTELWVQVIGDESIDERGLDALARQLARDLRAIRHLAIRPAVVEPPPLAKPSTVDQIGHLIISGLLSVTTVRAVRDVVLAYLARTKARAVTLRAGDRQVTLNGASAADLAAVTRQLDALVAGPDRAGESE